MLFYFSLAILVLVLGASVLIRRSFYSERESFKKFLLGVFIFSVIFVFSFISYLAFEQFQIWSHSNVSKYLLPPYQSIGYFSAYVGFRFFLPYFVSFVIGFLFFKTSKFFNKKYEERFFYPEEPYLGLIAIFLSGHPGWLAYFVVIISIYLVFHLISLFFRRSFLRIPLYYLWIPTGISVIIIVKLLENWPPFLFLKF